MSERGYPTTVPADDLVLGWVDGARRDDPGDRRSAMLSTPERCVIAHDIVDRLTSIIGWADLLQRRIEAGLDHETTLHGLATIQSSAEAMDELFREFLESRQLGADRGTRPRRAGLERGRTPR